MKPFLPLAVVAGLALGACSSGSSSVSSPGSSAPTTATPASSLAIGNPTKPVTLNESGSSLLYPYLQELVQPLAQRYANITLAPAAGGSGKGISDAIAGNVEMGGSDAYLTPGQLQANPGLMNIPIVISAQAINYNLSGISNLKLSGDVLAKIYQGTIVRWNDPAIAALNPGVALPAKTIVPVRRVDASGDTFIFTSLLSKTNSAWNSGPAFGTTVTWPAVPGEQTANGNPGMVQTCKATPGCIAYVGVSAESDATQAGLGEAMLQNQAGNFVQPTVDTITTAVANSTSNVPANLAASLIYAPGAQSYPIVNFEYLVVKASQADPATAEALRTFFSFAMDPNGGSTPALLSRVNFVALPTSVIPLIRSAIAKIS